MCYESQTAGGQCETCTLLKKVQICNTLQSLCHAERVIKSYVKNIPHHHEKNLIVKVHHVAIGFGHTSQGLL
jgi:hypothetical protein